MNISLPVLSTVFNSLVIFCIRDVYVALQRMLNLKPEKDQKKYELDQNCLLFKVFMKLWKDISLLTSVLFSG